MANVAPQPHSNRRGQGHHPRQRGNLPPTSGKRRCRLDTIINGPRGDRWPKGAEKIFKLCANRPTTGRTKIEFVYEPEEFPTGLTGARMGAIRPDYYLPEFDIYVEITTAGDTRRKLSKARGAMDMAAARGKALTIWVLDAQDMRKLRSGETEIHDVIAPAIELQATKIKAFEAEMAVTSYAA